MINIRSAKQMDLARIETIYNHIHDEEVGIVPCVFNGIKYNFRLAGIILLILYILTTIIKLEFRLAGGLLCHIYKER